MRAGFSVWFYRARGEAEYGERLRALLSSYSRFSKVNIAEPHLFCLGLRFPRNFRFIPHGRFGHLHEHDTYATHNEHIRETMYFMTRHKVICDYHNTEADILTDEGVAALYSTTSPFWMTNLSYKYSAF
eukprot:IDg9128t1